MWMNTKNCRHRRIFARRQEKEPLTISRKGGNPWIYLVVAAKKKTFSLLAMLDLRSIRGPNRKRKRSPAVPSSCGRASGQGGGVLETKLGGLAMAMPVAGRCCFGSVTAPSYFQEDAGWCHASACFQKSQLMMRQISPCLLYEFCTIYPYPRTSTLFGWFVS